MNMQCKNKRSPCGEKEVALSSLTHTSSVMLNESGVHISARNNSRGVFLSGSIYLRRSATGVRKRERERERERESFHEGTIFGVQIRRCHPRH